MSATAVHLGDPPVRADGRCVVCEKKRQPPKKSATNHLALKLAALDPFCSTECCRDYHHNPLPAKSIWGMEPEPLT